jgi:quinol monooxygenase YgiN
MSAVVELRQYTLKPGRRDALIALFEREFMETQEAEGIELIGTFRDADDPDRFVWLRGFPDMERRAKSLAAFYGGPVWKAHRSAANDTMIDSDNVLLLRPAWSGSGFATINVRAPAGATALPKGMVTASICTFGKAVPETFAEEARQSLDANFLAAFVTEESENNFPALPVRADHVFIGFSLFADAAQAKQAMLPGALTRQLARPVETLRLLPTARSRLHG